MIEGLRLLPWVHYEREKLKKAKNPEWRSYLDCDACKVQNSRRARAALHCAYVPRSEWIGYGFTPPRDWPPRIEPEQDEPIAKYHERVAELGCPGVSITLPEVIETARFYRWFDKGALTNALMGREMTPALRDALDILSNAIAEVDTARFED